MKRIFMIPGVGVLGKKQSLKEAILSTSPIVYFPMDEASGSTAINYGSLGVSANGSYVGVTLAQESAPGGGLAPKFDGINDYVNIYSDALAGAFNGQLGSIAFWIKVTNDDMWTDSSADIIFTLMADASNYISFQKRNANKNYIRVYYNAGGTLTNIDCLLAGTGWYFICITWSKANDQAKLFVNNSQYGDTKTTLGTWSGALAATKCNIGEYAPASGLPWNGYEAHFGVWNKVLSTSEMSLLYNKAASIIAPPASNGQAAVMFLFDDGVTDLYTNVYSIFATAGKKFTAYLITEKLDTAGYITTAHAQEMYAAGMDIGVHCHTHTSYGGLTQAQIETDLSTAKGIIEAAGMTRASAHAAYPFGVWSATVNAAMVAQSMVTGRTVTNGYMDFTQIHDRAVLYQLPTYIVDATVSLDLIKDIVDEAILYNKKISFLGHSVSGAEITKYTDAIAYVVSKNIPILTISEWYAQYQLAYP